MPEYSEATKRVLERALETLPKTISDEKRTQLRALVAEGRLEDLDAVEDILRPREATRDDR